MKTNHLFLACVALLVAAIAVSDHKLHASTDERLRHFIDAQGPLVYSALYALPETQATFVSAAGDEAWSTYTPSELSDLLSPEQKAQIVDAAANRIQTLSKPNQVSFFKRIRYWILADKQFQVFTGLTSNEQTLGIAFALPQTHDLYKEVIGDRGLDPKTIDSLLVGSTLASAERSALLYRLFTRISSLSPDQQAAYYRDFYNRLLELLKPNTKPDQVVR